MALILIDPGHDPEQHWKGISRHSDILRNVNAGDTVIVKLYNSKNIFNKKKFITVFWKPLDAIGFWHEKQGAFH